MTSHLQRVCSNLVGAVLLLLMMPAAGQQTGLVSFEIKDQFDRIHRPTDYTNRMVIMIASDRKGSAFHDDWESAIRDSLTLESERDDLAFISVAEVRGVPFFLRKNVKGKFSRREEKRVLLDWKGRLANAYGFVPSETNVLVFLAKGQLVCHVSGTDVDTESLAAVLTFVRAQKPAINPTPSVDHCR